MSKTITLRFRKINKDVFDAIKDGKKQVETRAATKKYQNLRVGDVVIFVCGTKRFSKKIKKVRRFKSVFGMLKKFKPGEINPKARSAKELVDIYYTYPGYKEKLKKYGIVVLELK